MSMQDPIADMLTRIRNAGTAAHKTVSVPSSKIKCEIAKVLKEEGYIGEFRVENEGTPKKTLIIDIKYYKRKPVIEGITRISKPACRSYCGSTEIPRVRDGLGIVILSTAQGIVSGKTAAKQNIGGEVICQVW